MLIGIIGKPSSGKTTILNALCMTDAKMGNYPFTTIEPNRGVAYVRVKCPCSTLKENCNPRSGVCIDGTRYVGVDILDVAGLVPGASEGKGMGNKFLDDLRRADLFIHVVDSSGTTDAEGNLTENYDIAEDIDWLAKELTNWIVKILYNDWDRLAKKLESDRSKLAETIHDKLSGLGAKLSDIKRLLNSNNLLNQDPRKWTDDDKFKFAEQLRLLLFPMIIAANKMDMHNAEDNITKLKNKYGEFIIISTSGLAELTLRKANETEIIQYFPGSNDFKIINNNHKQVKVLQAIKEKILQPRGSTGVTNLLEIAVFELLEMIAVFPVEDGTHLTDHDGRILPDVFLVEKGTTAKEFAGKIHSDLAKSFIHGILPLNSNKRIAANYELENEDVVKIVSAAK